MTSDSTITLEEISDAVKRLIKVDGVLIVLPNSTEDYTARLNALVKAELYRIAQECMVIKRNGK